MHNWLRDWEDARVERLYRDDGAHSEIAPSPWDADESAEQWQKQTD